jgi:hypothetical protein
MPEWAPFVLCLVRTGLRISEALALQPDDLDFGQRTIWVRRNGYRRRVTTPKSNRTRKVDMSQQLARTLQGWLSLLQAEAIVRGDPPAPWLFPGVRGGLLDVDWFTERVWRPLQARAGLRYRTPHQARHTFATLLLQQGESLDYVKVQLGHSSIRVTADTYVHWLPGSNRGAVDRLDAPDPASVRNPGATESRRDAEPRDLSDGPVNVPQDQAGQTPRGRRRWSAREDCPGSDARTSGCSAFPRLTTRSASGSSTATFVSPHRRFPVGPGPLSLEAPSLSLTRSRARRGRVADVRSSRETPDEPDLEAERFPAGRHAWRLARGWAAAGTLAGPPGTVHFLDIDRPLRQGPNCRRRG